MCWSNLILVVSTLGQKLYCLKYLTVKTMCFEKLTQIMKTEQINWIAFDCFVFLPNIAEALLPCVGSSELNTAHGGQLNTSYSPKSTWTLVDLHQTQLICILDSNLYGKKIEIQNTYQGNLPLEHKDLQRCPGFELVVKSQLSTSCRLSFFS